MNASCDRYVFPNDLTYSRFVFRKDGMRVTPRNSSAMFHRHKSNLQDFIFDFFSSRYVARLETLSDGVYFLNSKLSRKQITASNILGGGNVNIFSDKLGAENNNLLRFEYENRQRERYANRWNESF